ncbi:hypothetical protein VTP01DRAFT_1120 [Rhizomucor pusillus]|uniref:uncharacterized protein n=1 Tax=Rhizomucor pusillus TaxID=4840 RepID=UPI0037422F1D
MFETCRITSAGCFRVIKRGNYLKLAMPAGRSTLRWECRLKKNEQEWTSPQTKRGPKTRTAVLERLKEHKLYAEMEKSQFGVDRLEEVILVHGSHVFNGLLGPPQYQASTVSYIKQTVIRARPIVPHPISCCVRWNHPLASYCIQFCEILQQCFTINVQGIYAYTAYVTSFNVARLHGATNKGASKACKKSFFTPTPLDGMEKDDLMTCIETWEERISALQERSKELNMRKHTSIKTLSKAEQEGAKRADLKSLQLAKADAEYEALKNQLALKDFRAAVNHTKWMMKNQDRKDGSGKEQERMARPALEHHTYEARSEVLDLSRLQKEAARSYGADIITTVSTSYRAVQAISTVIDQGGRYEDGSNGNDELTSQRCNDLLTLPKPSTISSKHMYNKAMVYKNAKYREKRKARNPEVREAEENVANNNIHSAKSVEDVSNWQKMFREHRDTLQYFYNSPAENRAKCSQELARKKAYSQEASREKAYVKEACGTGKKSIPIMFIGDQGLGTNTRLNGHVKGVATKIRKEHHLHTVVAMTSEYRTSQTCDWCLGPVVGPKATILKDGKKKKRYVSFSKTHSAEMSGNDAQEDSVEGTDIQSSLDECKKIEGYFYINSCTMRPGASFCAGSAYGLARISQALSRQISVDYSGSTLIRFL